MKKLITLTLSLFMVFSLCLTISADNDGETTYAAQIEGGERYETIQAAIDAAKSGDKITILKDVENIETLYVCKEKNITINLNGKTISTAYNGSKINQHYYILKNEGVLVLEDSIGTGSMNSRGIDNYGTLTINSGTYASIDSGNGGASVWNNEDANLIINGGTLSVPNGQDDIKSQDGAKCIYNEYGNVEIYGGTFTSNSTYAYAIISVGNLTISPAKDKTVEVSGTKGGLGVNSGVAVIDGGTYSSSNYYGLYVSNDGSGTDPEQALVTVNGGTFDGKEYSVWIGSDYNDPVNSTIEINGGYFKKPINAQDNTRKNAITVKGGTFSSDVTNYLDTNKYEIKDLGNGTFEVAKLKVVAKIGDKEYTSLQAAIDAVDKNATTATTIDLIEDCEYGSIEVASNKKVILNLNEKTLKIGYILIQGGADLTITGNGTIDLKEQTYQNKHIVVGGTFTLENGTITTTGTHGTNGYEYIIGAEENSKVNIKGGNIGSESAPVNDWIIYAPGDGSTINISGGSLFTTKQLFVNNGNNPLTISGGTFNKDISDYIDAEHAVKQEGNIYKVVSKSEIVAVKIGDKTYSSLQDAISAANKNDTIVLQDNLTINKDITIEKDIILDLNGKTLTTNNQIVISAYDNEASLTVTNSTGDGKIILKDTSKCNASNGHIKVTYGGKFILKGGTIVDEHSGSGVAISVTGVVSGKTAEARIEGGTIDSKESCITISGTGVNVEVQKGTLKSGEGKDLFIVSTFTTTNKSDIHIYGGTFSNDVTKYLASGYNAVKKADGTYQIVSEKEEIKVDVDQNKTATPALEESVYDIAKSAIDAINKDKDESDKIVFDSSTKVELEIADADNNKYTKEEETKVITEAKKVITDTANKEIKTLPLDITLNVVNGEDKTPITDLSEEITVTLYLNDETLSAIKDNKPTVVRIHGEEYKALDTTLKGNALSFKTDKFSTYVIAYTNTSSSSGSDSSSSTTTTTTPTKTYSAKDKNQDGIITCDEEMNSTNWVWSTAKGACVYKVSNTSAK